MEPNGRKLRYFTNLVGYASVFLESNAGNLKFTYGFLCLQVFNKAMAGHSQIYMRAILDAYHGFEDVKVLVDVGGGLGSSLKLITTKYPHIKGINFDQPHVIDTCPELLGENFCLWEFKFFAVGMFGFNFIG